LLGQTFEDNTDDLLKILQDNKGGVDKIDQETLFEEIQKIVQSDLNCKIPVPRQLFHRLIKKNEAYAKANFEVLGPSEDNNIWVKIAALVQLSPSEDNSSEFDNISKYDALIKVPLELILSTESVIKMTRNTSLSTNLSKSPLNTSNHSSGSNSSQPGSTKSDSKSKKSSRSGLSQTGSAKSTSNSSTDSNKLQVPPSASAAFSSVIATPKVLDISREHLASKPDFAVYANNFLMLVGEEESSNSLSEDASQQLVNHLGQECSRLPWLIFGNIPFLFGYTACGNIVKLFCFNRSKKCYLLCTYNLNNKLNGNCSDCVKLFVHMINVARIILELSRKPLKWSLTYNNFLVKEERLLGATVFCHLYGAVKVYEKKSTKFNSEKENRVIDIYNHLKMHPNTYNGYAIQCTKIVGVSSEASTVEIYLEPLCKPIESQFKDVRDLLNALWCVLKALVQLHANNYVHGDIRWSNIMYDVVEKKYLLIDFDNGGVNSRELTSQDDFLKGYPKEEMKRHGEY
jgi:hypothetical protein